MKIAILPPFSASEPHFVRKGCDRTRSKSQFYLSFRRSNIISCERVATGTLKSQFYCSFWRLNFVPKGSPDLLQIAILLQCFWRSSLISCERVALGQVQMKITILPQFLAIERHFVRKGCVGPVQNRNFTAVFGDRTSFRAKGLRRTREIAILLQFLAIEHRFVRNGCVSCRLVVNAPRLKKEIDKKERARGQERM